jgi:hypothetical protein
MKALDNKKNMESKTDFCEFFIKKYWFDDLKMDREFDGDDN